MPSWFISLDFVPHLSNSVTIVWHRTAKSHREDLFIFPPADIDRLPVQELGVSHSVRPGELAEAFQRSASRASSLAQAWFDRITDVESLIPLFEEERDRPGAAVLFDSYVQRRLAFAFVLARSGDPGRAHGELDRWSDRNLAPSGLGADSRRAAARAQLHDLLDEQVQNSV